MKKHFCDRCEREVETILRFPGGLQARLHDISFLIEDKHSGTSLDDYIIKSFEVCYECFSKGSEILREWFYNK